MIYTIIIVVVLCVAWVSVFYYRANRFQRTMRVGDKCSFYIDLDRFEGRIAYFEKDMVIIKYVWGTVVKNKKEVYP